MIIHVSFVSDTVSFCTPLGQFAFTVLVSPPKLLLKLILIIHHHSILSIIIIHIFGFFRYPLIFVFLGHTLLERYGMTEIGMALSNPLHGSRLPVRHFFTPYSCTHTFCNLQRQSLLLLTGQYIPPGDIYFLLKRGTLFTYLL